MLGSLKSAPAWKWAAFGKHPVAGDYFYAGTDDPFFQAFSGWVENGFNQVSAGRKNATDLYSWRFWTKGYQKDTLLCGVGRDSFDTIGRPYPLVIMGAGTLVGWQQHLALLPFALEKSWIQMEYMATKRYMDFSQLENNIKRIPIPESKWPALQNDQQQRWHTWYRSDKPIEEAIGKKLAENADTPECLVAMDSHSCRDAITAAGLWHSRVAEQDGIAPNAAFLGGIQDKTYVAFFRRPLIVPDFVRLWSVGRGGVRP